MGSHSDDHFNNMFYEPSYRRRFITCIDLHTHAIRPLVNNIELKLKINFQIVSILCFSHADCSKFLMNINYVCTAKFCHYWVQDIFESMGQFVDGLKFSGGSHSLMPKASIKEIIDLAHRHDIYVSTGDWAEHMLRKGPSSFKQYVEVS